MTHNDLSDLVLFHIIKYRRKENEKEKRIKEENRKRQALQEKLYKDRELQTNQRRNKTISEQ